jgi:hypothetical protein
MILFWCPTLHVTAGIKHMLHTVFMTRKPYLAMIHSLFALPLSIYYFAFVWTLVITGGFTYYLFGLGLIILVVVARFMRIMTTFEVFLAKKMLNMGDRLDYPHDNDEGPTLFGALGECDFLAAMYQTSRHGINKYKTMAGNMITLRSDEIEDEQDFYQSDEDETLSSKQQTLPQQRTSNSNTNTDTNADDDEDDEVPLSINATTVTGGRNIRKPGTSRTASGSKNNSIGASSLTVHQYYQQQSYGTSSINLFTNNEYYQQYGTMMSRSLDHDDFGTIVPPRTTPNTAEIVIIKRAPSREKTNIASISTIQQPNLQQSINNTPPRKRSKKRRGSVGQLSSSSSPSRSTRQQHDISHHDSETTSNRNRSLRQQFSAMTKALRSYVFHSSTGFGLLYVVVKLPVSIVTFSATILLLVACLGGHAPALLHLFCDNSKNNYHICTLMTRGSEKWGWLIWIVMTVQGNVLASLISAILFTPCVYMFHSVTKLARDAIAIIGDDLDSRFN